MLAQLNCNLSSSFPFKLANSPVSGAATVDVPVAVTLCASKSYKSVPVKYLFPPCMPYAVAIYLFPTHFISTYHFTFTLFLISIR